MLANALGYVVERRLLPANPLDQIQWKASQVAETVDRRLVANPAQAGRLLKAVQGQGRRGQHMEAFFGCLYYAPGAAWVREVPAEDHVAAPARHPALHGGL